MRLCTYDDGGGPKPGAVEGDSVRDLTWLAPTMEALIEGGPATLRRLADEMSRGVVVPLDRATVRAPLRPSSLRDFLAFEDHAKAGAARRGEELNPAWYEMPVYYKGNHRQILGPDEPLIWPAWTEKLDFECELACIVGARGRDLTDEQAQGMIFGYTVMNDWSARDVQRAEMAMRLGPAKSKDFATSLGPWIVTADEFDPREGLTMSVRVDGETWFESAGARMHWTFPQMIAYVSRGEDVYPCDVYGSGTAFGGCGLDQDRWVPRGATVEVTIQEIGTLRTVLA